MEKKEKRNFYNEVNFGKKGKFLEIDISYIVQKLGESFMYEHFSKWSKTWTLIIGTEIGKELSHKNEKNNSNW